MYFYFKFDFYKTASIQFSITQADSARRIITSFVRFSRTFIIYIILIKYNTNSTYRTEKTFYTKKNLTILNHNSQNTQKMKTKSIANINVVVTTAMKNLI